MVVESGVQLGKSADWPAISPLKAQRLLAQAIVENVADEAGAMTVCAIRRVKYLAGLPNTEDQ